MYKNKYLKYKCKYINGINEYPCLANVLINNNKYCILFYKNNTKLSYIFLYNNYNSSLNHDINIVELPRLKTVPLLSLEEKETEQPNFLYIKDIIDSTNQGKSIILSYDNKFLELKFNSNKYIYIDYNKLIKLINDDDIINDLIMTNIRLGTTNKIEDFMLTVDKKNNCVIFNSYIMIKSITNYLFKNKNNPKLNTYIDNLLSTFNEGRDIKFNDINEILYDDFIIFLQKNNIIYKKYIRLSEKELKDRNTSNIF